MNGCVFTLNGTGNNLAVAGMHAYILALAVVSVETAYLTYLNGSVGIDVTYHHTDCVAVCGNKKGIALAACLHEESALVK